ncbi:hypothetical protein B0H11DRAFT_2218358 [Mycena galericulata]|nr:hypothetical protein B0H11DRAFT_2218358 [Mycena galericulata]
MSEMNPVESPAIPQFSANLFAGPCFGDLTPSEVVVCLSPSVASNIEAQSAVATLPDAPSPSPLLLDSIADSSSSTNLATARSEPAHHHTEDLIEFTIPEEQASDLLSSNLGSSPIQIHAPSDQNMNPVHSEQPSQTPATHFSTSSFPKPHASNALAPLDEQPLAHATRMVVETDLVKLDFRRDEPLEQTYLTEPPFDADENAMIPDVANPEPETICIIDESFLTETTDTLTRPLPDQDMPDTSVFPSSSPSEKSPLTPTAHSSSPLLSDAVYPSSNQPTPSEHSDNSVPLLDDTLDFTTFPPSDDLRSSPPNSSPEPLFLSSPPPASDSSEYLDNADFLTHKSELYERISMDTPILTPPTSSPQPRSSPPVIPTPIPDDSLNQDDLYGPPPSSSPLLSSSPLHPESMEQQPSLELDQVDSSYPTFPAELPGQHLPHPQSAEQKPSQLDDARSRSPPAASPPISLVQAPFQTILPKPDEVQDMSVPLGEIQMSQTVLPESPTDALSNGYGQNDPRSLKKRKREEEPARGGGELLEEITTTQPPNPKRPTLASQKLQRKTLTKPFRSPAMKAPKALESAPPPLPKKEAMSLEQPTIDYDLKKKHRTQRAAGQFKSPLSLDVSASLPSSVRQTPTIQTLERKVQVLRRAVKIKKEGEEQTLEGLVKKWTEAGREVAWEVWGLVKDNESGGGDDWGKDSGTGKRRFEDSWGWNEDSGSKRIKVEETERNWGWDVSPTTDRDDHPAEQRIESTVDEDKPKETMGTMLMRLGIAPATLGWNNEEGEFVDN